MGPDPAELVQVVRSSAFSPAQSHWGLCGSGWVIRPSLLLKDSSGSWWRMESAQLWEERNQSWEPSVRPQGEMTLAWPGR